MGELGTRSALIQMNGREEFLQRNPCETRRKATVTGTPPDTGSVKVSYCGANQETADPKRPTAQEVVFLTHRITRLDVGS